MQLELQQKTPTIQKVQNGEVMEVGVVVMVVTEVGVVVMEAMVDGDEAMVATEDTAATVTVEDMGTGVKN